MTSYFFTTLRFVISHFSARRICRTVDVVVISLVALLGGSITRAADLTIQETIATATRAKMRVLESRHLVLITDRPERRGDGIDEFPGYFDEAVEQWCKRLSIDTVIAQPWKTVGCLIVDRNRFRSIGLLPDSIPPFKNGYCNLDRFWLMDQSSPYYRRHLFLHEGVHSIATTLRHAETDAWYTEGLAELLSTHRIEDGHCVLTPIPESSADVQQLGRIEALREARLSGKAKSIEEVFASPPDSHFHVSSYAWNWAAVAMLTEHPRYAAAMAKLQQGPLDQSFTARLLASADINQEILVRDFDAFSDDVDYGYRFSHSAVDWLAEESLTDQKTVVVNSSRGWQSAGIFLSRGDRVRFTAKGRFTLGSISPEIDQSGSPLTLTSEADGITLEWYRGRPLGRLLVSQWIDHAPLVSSRVAKPKDDRLKQDHGHFDARPGFFILETGQSAEFVAAFDGPLFCKMNDFPRSLADNTGTLDVTFKRLDSQ